MMRKYSLWVVIALVFVAGVLFGSQFTLALAGPNGQGRDQIFEPFWDTWDYLHSEYVDPLDDNALMEAALNGMVNSLGDQHTFYMDPETFEIINTDLEGEFEGIGATVRQDEDSGALVIINTLPGAPAEAAGLESGDAIVQVDGVDITTMPQSEIISRIRGPKDTEVELGILRESEPDMLLIAVTRDRITIASVQARSLENDLVYIRVAQFGADTAAELREQLQTFDVEHRVGLILDFRGNPGGFLTSAVDVASEFMPEGVVLIERLRDSEREYRANGNPTAPTVPIVILVDEGSASGAELVAGALQDMGRATIIGMQTFGKGSVQSWHALSNGGGVRVTIARWYTPNDRTIHEVGLAPDIEVPLDEDLLPDVDTQLQAAVDLLSAPVEAAAAQ